MSFKDQHLEEIAGTALETWATEKLGKSSVVVMAIALGRLCKVFEVPPEDVSELVRQVYSAAGHR
jgi:hypothetical protein